MNTFKYIALGALLIPSAALPMQWLKSTMGLNNPQALPTFETAALKSAEQIEAERVAFERERKELAQRSEQARRELAQRLAQEAQARAEFLAKKSQDLAAAQQEAELPALIPVSAASMPKLKEMSQAEIDATNELNTRRIEARGQAIAQEQERLRQEREDAIAQRRTTAEFLAKKLQDLAAAQEAADALDRGDNLTSSVLARGLGSEAPSLNTSALPVEDQYLVNLRTDIINADTLFNDVYRTFETMVQKTFGVDNKEASDLLDLVVQAQITAEKLKKRVLADDPFIAKETTQAELTAGIRKLRLGYPAIVSGFKGLKDTFYQKIHDSKYAYYIKISDLNKDPNIIAFDTMLTALEQRIGEITNS